VWGVWGGQKAETIRKITYGAAQRENQMGVCVCVRVCVGLRPRHMLSIIPSTKVKMECRAHQRENNRKIQRGSVCSMECGAARRKNNKKNKMRGSPKGKQ